MMMETAVAHRSLSAGRPPRVLLVDDDADCLQEVAATVTSLGYECRTAQSADAGLDIFAADETIGIVITDIEMPGASGLDMLEKMQDLVGRHRAMAAVVLSGRATVGAATKALRLQAVDLIEKPARRTQIQEALGEAVVELDRQRRLMTDLQLDMVAAELKSTMQLLQAMPKGASLATPRRAAARTTLTPAEATARIVELMQARRVRANHFPPEIFGEPGWDIILDLARAQLGGRKVSVSSASLAGGVPISTGLRCVHDLLKRGILIRIADPTDRRRDFVELSQEALQGLMNYLRLADVADGQGA